MRRGIMYKDYQKMVTSRAWAWSRRTGIDVQELIAEGNLVFCKCFKEYDSTRASFSTYLYNSLQMHYGNMVNTSRCLKAERKELRDLYAPEQCSFQLDNPEQKTIFNQMVENLTADAKEVVEVVFETPLEIIEAMGITKISRASIQLYFRTYRKWNPKRIWDAFTEIQKTIA